MFSFKFFVFESDRDKLTLPQQKKMFKANSATLCLIANHIYYITY